MAKDDYVIYRTDGTKSYIVPVNLTNNETSITMIGHGKPTYGEEQNTNFLHMLENFSNTEAPTNPIKGQLWFQQLEGSKYALNVCKNTSPIEWDKLAILNSSNDKPTSPESGDMWYDMNTHTFKVYDSILNDWNSIGPNNIMHNESIHESRVINTGSETFQATFQLEKKLFEKDIENDMDANAPSGCLSLVTVRILAKEICNTVNNSNTVPRSAAWIYKFLVNSYKHHISGGNPIYVTDIVGCENYELIGITENTDWMVDLNKTETGFMFKVQDNSTNTGTNLTSSRIVVGFDVDIVRI